MNQFSPYGGNSYENVYAYHYSGRPTSIVLKVNGTPTATRTFSWDKESRITALSDGTTSASYVYNGADTRTSKTVGATTTTFKRAGAGATAPVLADVAGGTTTNPPAGHLQQNGRDIHFFACGQATQGDQET